MFECISKRLKLSVQVLHKFLHLMFGIEYFDALGIWVVSNAEWSRNCICVFTGNNRTIELKRIVNFKCSTIIYKTYIILSLALSKLSET